MMEHRELDGGRRKRTSLFYSLIYIYLCVSFSNAALDREALLEACAQVNLTSSPFRTVCEEANQTVPDPIGNITACRIPGCDLGDLGTETFIACDLEHMLPVTAPMAAFCTELFRSQPVELSVFCPLDNTINPASLSLIAQYASHLEINTVGDLCCNAMSFGGWPALQSVTAHCLPQDDTFAASNASIKSLDITNADQQPYKWKWDAFTQDSLTTLSTLDLSSNGLISLPAAAFARLSQLETLELYNNRIGAFDEGVFSKLSALKELNLFSNRLTSIGQGLLDGLTSLTLLNVSNNFIFELHSHDFDSLSRLEELYLNNNELSNIDDAALLTLTTIATMSLQYNDIEAIDTVIFRSLDCLKSLDLSHNRITQLKVDEVHVGHLYNVSYLDLSYNSLADLEEPTLWPLPALKYLNLGSNRLKRLYPRQFENATQLEELHLWTNRYQYIPTGIFAMLTKLKTLEIDTVPLKWIPPDMLASMPDLETFSLYFTSLQFLDADMFAHNSKLQTLSMHSNRLTAIHPSLFDNLINLTSLRLDGNLLRTVDETTFANISNLQSLDLSSNFLQSLPELLFDRLSNLKELRLGKNTIGAIRPTHFDLLPNLETLDLSYCCLLSMTPLDVDWSTYRHLTTLRLHDVNLVDGSFASISSSTTLSVLDLGGPQVCVDSPEMDLSSWTSLLGLARVSISYTPCQKIVLGLSSVNVTVQVTHNDYLSVLEYTGNPVIHNLEINNNPKLETLPSNPVSGIDISYSAIRYTPALCNVLGTQQIYARGLINAQEYADNVFEFLSDCLYKCQLVDLSNNDFMNNMDALVQSIGVPFLLKSPLLDPEYQVEGGRYATLRNTDDVTVLSLEDLPIGCSLSTSTRSVRYFSQKARTVVAADIPVNMYTCKCVPGFTLEKDKCVRKRSFLEKPGAIALVTIVSLVGGALLALLVRHIYRKQKQVRFTIQHQQRLLQDAEEEVHALRKAWDIDFSELQLLHRIDGEHPGAYGEVWKAQWGSIQVAVKMAKEAISTDSFSVDGDGFEKEVMFLQRIRHPNLVRFFGAGATHDGFPFILLEFVELGALRTFLQSDQALHLRVKVQLLLDVARGMEYIHSQGHMHRDLKTGNVLVTSQIHAKISDFGTITKSFKHLPTRETGGALLEQEDSSLTAGVGTPMFTAPEVLRGGDYGKKADVFSFGIVMWEVATLRKPDYQTELELGVWKGPFLSNLLRLLESGGRLPLAAEVIPCWYRDMYLETMQTNAAARPSFSEIVRLIVEERRTLVQSSSSSLLRRMTNAWRHSKDSDA